MSKFLDVSGAESKVAWASEILERSVRNYELWSKNNLILTSLIDQQVILQKWVLYVKSLPPSEVILGFGDVLSNLRSALDYLAWEVFSVCGGMPDSQDARRIYFPIAADPVGFNQQRKSKLKGAWPEAIELAKSQQDYELGDAQTNTLQILDALCNSQKHRTLHVAAVSPDFEAMVQVGPQSVSNGERLVMDIPDLRNLPLRQGHSMTVARYWMEEDTERGRERPLPRLPEMNYPSMDPPQRNIALTDGHHWIHVDDIGELVRHVRSIVSAFSKLSIPDS